MAKSIPAEEKLIQQAQNGDLDAFNELVLHFQDLVYTVAYRIMGESESASDITQDTFITAYRKLDTFRGGKFSAWLARIATNACYDELRKYKRRPTTSIEDLPDAERDDGPALPSNEETPEQQAVDSELNRAIQDCINRLKEDQRIVLILSDVQGYSYPEIADTRETQIGTVKSRLSRARKSVQGCLQAVQELLPGEYRLNTNP